MLTNVINCLNVVVILVIMFSTGWSGNVLTGVCVFRGLLKKS